ncbi:P22 phage major capsid protein family protein [Leucobacter sp. G161]|uniref:P22 phage major capsid protein family protein n=1 Tax=Leucobacter sp. G161 TaxID=663704 RepID=UPI00073CCED2|nr:P22 phage major capsid protein family protein [Leucobacter sp. G161]KUF07184.1 hypothetical protein AUL38_02540 [Leucobacter sp. G161]
MALNKFIKEVWSAKILVSFHDNAVVTGTVDRDYEQDAVGARRVHIPGVVPVEVKDYATGVALDADGDPIARTTEPDEITDTGVDLDLDQEKSFDFLVDDIDAAQSNPKVMGAYTDSAARGLNRDADKSLLALAVTSGRTLAGSTAATDAKTAWNIIRDLAKELDKAEVPEDERFAVVNAEFAALLREHDSKITKANESGSTAGLRRATLGEILNFTVLQSSNLPQKDKPQVTAYHTSALAFASQIQKTEAMRAEKKFADRVRGLHVYGHKVLNSTGVVTYTGA